MANYMVDVCARCFDSYLTYKYITYGCDKALVIILILILLVVVIKMIQKGDNE